MSEYEEFFHQIKYLLLHFQEIQITLNIKIKILKIKNIKIKNRKIKNIKIKNRKIKNIKNQYKLTTKVE